MRGPVRQRRSTPALLDISEDIEFANLSDFHSPADGWQEIIEAVSRNQRGDFALKADGNRSILVTLTRDSAAPTIQWILLRDIEAIEFRRDRTFRLKSSGNIRFLSNEKTRPDFLVQRQICSEINVLLSRGERAIRQRARILITGKSGVDKSEIARFLRSTVADARDPFIIVNCASSSEVQFDALLFGHDAPDGRHLPGMIEQAEGGTLFLDEVCEIPLSTQAKLLGFLDDGRLPHMQAQANRPPRVRIISATNRDLCEMVGEGRFCADLYFRLAVIGLHVSPLRDLPPLTDHLIDRFS
ncbi:sigma 54-interacting transcriptional regulator [Breoghania sp.]|uniref:sigma-54-dependent transcriptional regulator n=1 Tax=Breoghania sp. TaxID=2065378 RepID=UPI0026263AA3|nr:sigma 54-interacting transcriptional regulator [Breoghania sp.]MDJ0933393.1 sigma 54-interacting transcriptional regulator [Breoghania sp.]